MQVPNATKDFIAAGLAPARICQHASTKRHKRLHCSRSRTGTDMSACKYHTPQKTSLQQVSHRHAYVSMQVPNAAKDMIAAGLAPARICQHASTKHHKKLHCRRYRTSTRMSACGCQALQKVTNSVHGFHMSLGT